MVISGYSKMNCLCLVIAAAVLADINAAPQQPLAPLPAQAQLDVANSFVKYFDWNIIPRILEKTSSVVCFFCSSSVTVNINTPAVGDKNGELQPVTKKPDDTIPMISTPIDNRKPYMGESNDICRCVLEHLCKKRMEDDFKNGRPHRECQVSTEVCCTQLEEPIIKPSTTLPPQNPSIEPQTSHLSQNPAIGLVTTPLPHNYAIELETTPIPHNFAMELETTPLPQNPVIELESIPLPKNPAIELETTPLPQDPAIEPQTTQPTQNPVTEQSTTELPQNPVIELQTTQLPQNLLTEQETTQPLQNPVDKLQTSEGLPTCGIRNQVLRETNSNEIKDSSETNFGEFPWVVAVLNEDRIQGLNITIKVYGGVGALIHPRVVMTGGHIAAKFNPNGTLIRAGVWDSHNRMKDKDLDYQDRYVEEIYIHEDFQPKNLINGVALILLIEPVILKPHINLICMPEQDEKFDYYTNCIANGWGKTGFGRGYNYSTVLKKVEVNMVEYELCNGMLRRTALGPFFKLHPTFVCAGGEEGRDTCQGDGGAPLVCPVGNNQYKLTGMVAWSIGCGQKDVPGVYINVPAFRLWTDNQLVAWGLR